MQKNLKMELVFRWKKIQFRYRTLRNRREISRAYRSERVISAKQVKIALTVVGAVAAASLLVLAAPTVFNAARRAIVAYHEEATQRAAEREKRKAAKASTVRVDTAKETASRAPVLPPIQLPAESRQFSSTTKYVLFANKTTQRLYLLEVADTAYTVLRSYFIAIGKKQGPKERANDKKTPEGIYCIIGKKTRSELSAIYGPIAYILNYPNEEDVKAGRNGQGIWIHGTPQDSFPQDTRGCLDLHNEDLIDLARHIGDGIGTPILITSAPDSTAALARIDLYALQSRRVAVMQEYLARQLAFVRMVDQWKDAWESMDIGRYSGFYDTLGFFSEGKGWSAWRERKTATFRTYSDISVSADNIFLSEYTDTSAAVKFVQKYASNVSQVKNGKKLVFIQRGGLWKINQEITFPQEELFL